MSNSSNPILLRSSCSPTFPSWNLPSSERKGLSPLPVVVVLHPPVNDASELLGIIPAARNWQVRTRRNMWQGCSSRLTWHSCHVEGGTGLWMTSISSNYISVSFPLAGTDNSSIQHSKFRWTNTTNVLLSSNISWSANQIFGEEQLTFRFQIWQD